MKTHITFCLLIFFAISAAAQDVKDSFPSINTSHAMLDNGPARFIKAWNSGSINGKLDSAMDMNYNFN